MPVMPVQPSAPVIIGICASVAAKRGRTMLGMAAAGGAVGQASPPARACRAGRRRGGGRGCGARGENQEQTCASAEPEWPDRDDGDAAADAGEQEENGVRASATRLSPERAQAPAGARVSAVSSMVIRTLGWPPSWTTRIFLGR